VRTIDQIRRNLGEYTPRILSAEQCQQAAVAVVFREGAQRRPEVLFIKRALHPADPWSGHIAFPGGRVDLDDATVRSAAERETLEEVGLPEAERLVASTTSRAQGRRSPRRHRDLGVRLSPLGPGPAGQP
jgi:8-oxo-dGTP pyrophosphatase MutT (NUDIX family)